MAFWTTPTFAEVTAQARRQAAYQHLTGASDRLTKAVGVTRADLYSALLFRFR